MDEHKESETCCVCIPNSSLPFFMRNDADLDAHMDIKSSALRSRGWNISDDPGEPDDKVLANDMVMCRALVLMF